MDKARDLLGRNLRRLRSARKWTQSELAEESELSVKMIQKLEYGKTNASADTLDSLAEALGVDQSELFVSVKNKAGAMVSTSAPVDVVGGLEILSKYQGLSPSLKKLACAVLFERPSYLADLPPEAGPHLANFLAVFQKQIRTQS